ncbi:MAG: hypothetical protein QF662_04945, partial [Phycisphaerae bacterium]|nr:hypothetical protein [Phycisphaerae bacterium]
MSRKIKTLIAVAFLTIVVWTAIDFEVTDKFEATVHNITVQAPNPDYKVTVVSPESGRISVVFTGPRGQVSKLRVTPEDLSFRYVLGPSELRPG